MGALLLLACLPAAAPQAASTPALNWSDCRLEHPLQLSSLEASCTRLAVPEDRSAEIAGTTGAVKAVPAGATADAGRKLPAGATRIQLKIARVRALNRRSEAAPLFLLAGGPGQSAVALYAAMSGAFARIHRNHDIVLVDQRGTGGSSPMPCEFPEDWSDAASSPAAVREAAQRCLEQLGPRVRHYTTAAAVLDLDAVRQALGYARIDLYGASYGTRVAQAYMRRFPDRLEAVILDGVTDPQRPIGPDTPLDGERALQLILGRCLADADCAKAYPDLRRDWSELRARFGPARQSIELADPSDARPTPLVFDRVMLSAALRLLSYSASQASLLPYLLHTANGGDVRPLAAQAVMTARRVGDQLAIGMQNTVICSEDWPALSAQRIDREALAKTYMGADQIDALAEICAIWPRGPVAADQFAPLRSNTPTLLLSGEADPVTPPAGADRAAQGLAHHRHLVLAGEGHGQLGTGCVPRLMAAFLDRPSPEDLDTGCLKQHRPAPFFLSVSGPAP
jgi:pimeloyl-ACP methyl ester carboxylesterase